MNVTIAGIEYDSVVDGPGVRTTVFFQGCPHNCPGCHNPESHTFDGGIEMDCDELVKLLVEIGNPVTFSGGEPICQFQELAYIIKQLNRRDTWVYTGFIYETIAVSFEHYNLSEYIECVVDGHYEEKLKSMDCQYRGSTNQRLIDGHKSRSYKTVEWSPRKIVKPLI